MTRLSLNPIRTLRDRFWILLSYVPFLNRLLLFLRAKTPSFLMSRASNQGSSKPDDTMDVHHCLKLLSQQSNAIMCHLCGELLTLRQFEKHVFDKHGETAGCIWCDQISETSDEKIGSIQLKPSEPLIFARPEDLLKPPPEPTPPLYQDKNLSMAASNILVFVDPRETHAWYHVTVSKAAFDSFRKALDEDEGHTNTLNFSCWCDAGPHLESMHRQHRHLVVISPAHHFEQHVWPKVTGSDASFPCKSLERITSPMQLLRIIGSLSSRESNCEKGEWQEGNDHHSYVFNELPADYKLPLALLWDGGLEELLYEWKFKNVDLTRVMQSPLSFVDGQWKQKVTLFYNIEKDLVLPVSRSLRPTWEPGQEEPLYTFHLLEGKKVYFYYSRRMGGLGKSKWLQKQMDGGNWFFENMGNAMWTLNPSDQEKLSHLIPQGKGSEKEAKEEAKPSEEEAKEEMMKEANEKTREETREEEKESGDGSALENETMEESKESGDGNGPGKESMEESKESGNGNGPEKESMEESKESGDGHGPVKETMEETMETDQ